MRCPRASLLGQHRQHHVVELLDPAPALHFPSRLRRLRELDELRPATRREERRERDLPRRVIAHLEVLALEVLPGDLVAEADEHLVLSAEERSGGEVGRAGENAPVAVRPVAEEKDLRVRDVALDHPHPQTPLLDTLSYRVPARCGKGPKRTVNVLHCVRLQRNDRGDIVHDPRVPEHALDLRLREPLEHRVQHLDARGVGENPDRPVPRKGLEVEVARLTAPGFENARSSPLPFGRKERAHVVRVVARRFH